jgi:hypothetical protein
MGRLARGMERVDGKSLTKKEPPLDNLLHPLSPRLFALLYTHVGLESTLLQAVAQQIPLDGDRCRAEIADSLDIGQIHLEEGPLGR